MQIYSTYLPTYLPNYLHTYITTSCFLHLTSYALCPTSFFLLSSSYFLLPTSFFLLPSSYFLLSYISSYFPITFLQALRVCVMKFQTLFSFFLFPPFFFLGFFPASIMCVSSDLFNSKKSWTLQKWRIMLETAWQIIEILVTCFNLQQRQQKYAWFFQ